MSSKTTLYLSNFLSFLFGKLCFIQWPYLLKPLVLRFFQGLFRINLSESVEQHRDFKSVNDMFTRTLRPECRTWEQQTTMICSPVDGQFKGMCYGNSATIRVKSADYNVKSLLGTSHTADIDNMVLVNLYLSPQDCHHIFSPCDVTIQHITYIPGPLLPVNPIVAKIIPTLFSTNERIVLTVQHKNTTFYIVLVGALNVGHMTLPSVPGFASNQLKKHVEQHLKIAHPELKKGDRLGTFNLGSSVLLLFDQDAVTLPE
ncbi:phosphatidylserine decarboxylase, partial [Candidatus Marinamargulisbacteria bacterium SCGC AG-414-C22]